MIFGKRRGSRDPVGQVVSIEGQDIAIIDLGRKVGSVLVPDIERNILTHGKPFESGGLLGPACLPILGAGSAVASSLLAGNVFLATANPATLMAIGSGVGSAVLGPTGAIIAQAPFVAASTAIVPVVAPLMLFMVVSSITMSTRFGRMQRTLDELSQVLEQILKRDLAEDHGRFLSAIDRLRDIHGEFQEGLKFTDEMKMRLVLVERDVNVLRHKYGSLTTGEVKSGIGAKLSPFDIQMFVKSSIVDLRVNGLRLKLALQDNPVDVKRSLSSLNGKMVQYEGEFRQLLENNSVKEYQTKMEETIEEMNWWQGTMPVWLGGRRNERIQKEQEIEEVRKVRDNSLDSVRMEATGLSSNLGEKVQSRTDPGPECSIVYYREDHGKGNLKAYYTCDLQLR